MGNMEKAIERIKILQCPTGDLENRVAGILQDYNVANSKEVVIKREENLDINGAEAYVAKIPSNKDEAIVVLAKSGMDDYVVKIVDAYKS